MKMVRLSVCTVAALYMLIGCAAQPKGELFDPREVQSASAYKFWDAKLPLVPGDAAHRCYLIDENLYVISEQGELFALQADTGLLRWTRKIAEPQFTVYRPSHLDTGDDSGPLAIATTRNLLIFDRYSGDEVARFPMPFAPGSGPVGDGTRIYMGSADGHMYSMLWRHATGSRLLDRWRIVAGGPVTAMPTLRDGRTLIFASQGGQVISCDSLDKSFIWGWRNREGIFGDPFVDDSGVYVAGADRSLYRLDVRTGRQLWRHRFPAPLVEGPVVSRFTCYQSCPGEGLFAIDVDSGEVKWQRKDGICFVASRPGEAVIRTTGQTLDVVDDASGETKRSIGAQHVCDTAVNVYGDSVFAVAADGRVACLKPAGVPYLKRQEVAAARTVLDRPANRSGEIASRSAGSVEEDRDPLRSRYDSGN